MNYNIQKIRENAWLRHAACECQGRQQSLCLRLPGLPLPSGSLRVPGVRASPGHSGSLSPPRHGRDGTAAPAWCFGIAAGLLGQSRG